MIQRYEDYEVILRFLEGIHEKSEKFENKKAKFTWKLRWRWREWRKE